MSTSYTSYGVTLRHSTRSGSTPLRSFLTPPVLTSGCCLRHYDVPSVRWSFGSGCAICRDMAREQVRPLTGCLAPDDACLCNICTRQPPSLRDVAFTGHFTLVLNIERFRLMRNVTYSQYRSACVCITVIYTFSCCPSRPSHCLLFPLDSPGLLPQHGLLPHGRGRSRLFTHTKSNIVRCATSRCFLKSVAPCMGKMGTKYLNLQKRSHPLFQIRSPV